MDAIQNMSVPESAKRAGVSTKDMWRRVWNREIEHVRIGRRVLIPEKALADFLAKNTVPVHEKGSVTNAIGI